MTSLDMCSFFLFSLVQLPFFFISPNRLRYFFLAKCVIVPAVALVCFISLDCVPRC